MGPKHAVVYGQRLRPAGKRGNLEFGSRKTIPRQRAFRESRVVRQMQRRVTTNAVYQQPSVEKLEDGLRFRILIHQIETRSGLRVSDLQPDAGELMLRHVADVAVHPPDHFEFFALLDAVPPSDETLYPRVGGGSVAGQ